MNCAKQIFLVQLLIFTISVNTLIAKEYSVFDFGATGKGEIVETRSIQKAIDEASIDGGVVLFPSGTYLTGTLYLKSNVTMHLQKGAIILGSTDLSDYPENLPEIHTGVWAMEHPQT